MNTMKKSLSVFPAFSLFLLLVLASVTHAQQSAATAPQREAVTRYEAAINAFLAEDKANPPPARGILFIGSSIFRQWAKLKEQMAPLPVFNRAFGGSRTSDILYHMDKIVLPYQPQIIVYYCGSNDINAGERAAPIVDRFRLFVARVWMKQPQTRIYFVSINRAPQKQDKWNVVDAANQLVKDHCATDKRLGFIDVNPALFDKDGKPRLELYQDDQLHFKEPAYDEFTAIIKPVLMQVWATGKTKAK